MMSEEIAVPTRRELVPGRMVCSGSVTFDCRTNGTDGHIGAGRNEQLTHERRKNHKPHGDEAKPCDRVFVGAELHGSQKFFRILSVGKRACVALPLCVPSSGRGRIGWMGTSLGNWKSGPFRAEQKAPAVRSSR